MYPIKLERIFRDTKTGIIDIGTRYMYNQEKSRIVKFLTHATCVVIPVEIGYESLIETIKDLRGFNRDLRITKTDVPIVLVLNKLDTNDSEKGFLAKKHFIESFREIVRNFEDETKQTLISFTGSDYYDTDSDEPVLPSFENENYRELYDTGNFFNL
jgi:GTPase SAR1 family protein